MLFCQKHLLDARPCFQGNMGQLIRKGLETMKVKIVDKKDDVKEMTIEELARREWIGLRGGSVKYILVDLGGNQGYQFVGPRYCLDVKEPKAAVLKEYITGGSHSEGHVFDSARELYLWMAE